MDALPSAANWTRSASLASARAHPTAAAVCLFGLMLRIVISDPIMDILGIPYSTDASGSFLTKIHIGDYFIYLSAIILLLDRSHPLRQAMQIFHHYRVFCFFVLIDLMLFAYWMVRGPKGAGLMIDTHLPVPIAAIVLSYAPRAYCRRAVQFFLAFAVVNSIVGIVEAIGKFRIYTFDPDWVVLKEDQFRASALLGHPLSNATFTAVALPIALALRMNNVVKGLMAGLFIVALVGFGGRAALSFSVLGLALFAVGAFAKTLRRMTLLKLFVLMLLVVVVPAILGGLLYGSLESGMGERLRTFSSLTDESAEARRAAFQAFDQMSREELLLGVSRGRVEEITYRLSQSHPMSDIENPWILMIMQLGVIGFSVWLIMTVFFIRELLWGKNFALRLAVLAYFVTASTFNSFGRKDFLYMVMVAAVICAARGFPMETDAERLKALPPEGA